MKSTSKSILAKKTSITLPPQLEKQLQTQARSENKSLSGVIQDAARFYLNIKQWDSLQREMALKGRAMGLRSESDVDSLVHESRP